MNYLKHVVLDNFFDDFQIIEEHFKKIKLYKVKEYNKKFNINQNWPGSRSNFLHLESPFLYNLYNKEFKIKFGDIFDGHSFNVDSYIHLRLSDDSKKDWIHRDSSYFTKYTCLVYLSKSNIDSGTYIFSEDKKIITDVKFIQNRAFLFDSRYLHSAYGHHGSSIDDGRIVLTSFYKQT